MTGIIECPSCGGKLRVSEESHGQKVRCPMCHHTFDCPTESKPPATPFRAPQDLPLDLTLDEPSSPPPAASVGTPGPFGAIELTPSSQQTPPRRADKRLD
jgi:predicted Zn finger-like uncharacterized protein